MIIMYAFSKYLLLYIFGVRLRVCTYVCMRACTHVCARVCTHVCMWVTVTIIGDVTLITSIPYVRIPTAVYGTT